jgi:cytochrome c-type biogenesis protein CcmH/NrfG
MQWTGKTAELKRDSRNFRTEMVLTMGRTLYSLGVCLSKLQKFEPALPELEGAERLNPTSSEIHYQLAQVMMHLNEPQRAGDALETLTTLGA